MIEASTTYTLNQRTAIQSINIYYIYIWSLMETNVGTDRETEIIIIRIFEYIYIYICTLSKYPKMLLLIECPPEWSSFIRRGDNVIVLIHCPFFFLFFVWSTCCSKSCSDILDSFADGCASSLKSFLSFGFSIPNIFLRALRIILINQ